MNENTFYDSFFFIFYLLYTGLGTQKMSPRNWAVLYPKVSFLSNR